MEALAFVIWVIVVGFVVGALARLVVPGNPPMGIVGTVIVGIAGSLLAGLLSWFLISPKNELVGFLLAIGCAALLLWVLAGSGGRRVRL